MHSDITKYNESQAPIDRAICQLLAEQIERGLPEAENKIWHAHPVWFIDGNPIVGYSKLKNCVRLLFWSGQSFEEERGSKKKEASKPLKHVILPPKRLTQRSYSAGWPKPATSSGITKTWPVARVSYSA